MNGANGFWPPLLPETVVFSSNNNALHDHEDSVQMASLYACAVQHGPLL